MSVKCRSILTKIWTTNSLLRKKDRNANNEHAQYQWEDILRNTKLGQMMTTHMKKITEPGATAMWTGFTLLACVGQRVGAIIFFSAFALEQFGWAFSATSAHNIQ